uniref:Fungal lipase-type domain-containing protein n=1 Tax=Hyaloperonospora arabidopsidis (strain Emoy2) TaxID=559515 RepID=M4B972_HYAAE
MDSSEAAGCDVRMATRAGRRAELQKLSSGQDEWMLYRTLCQFRLGYFSFLVLICILMFSVTLLMEIFFAIFLPSARMDPYFTLRSIMLLALLPIALVFLSYCFEESSRLFLDAIDTREGSLANFRLSLCVCIHYLRHWREMPDDRLERAKFDAFRADDEDLEAWARFVSWITAGPRYLLSTIYTNDPFDDVNKESEDERRYELELLFQRQHSGKLGDEPRNRFVRRRSSSSSSSSSDDLPSSRWKRAFHAASTTVKFNTTHFDGPPLDFSTLVITDVICPFVFEFITLWTFMVSLVANMSPLAAFLDYIQCGFYMQAIYLGLWMICHFCSARNRKMREFVSNYRRRYRDMQRELLEMENEKRAEHLWLVSIGFRAVEQFQTSFFTLVEAIFELSGRVCKRLSLRAPAADCATATSSEEDQPLQPGDVVQYTQVELKPEVLVEGTCDPVEDANETQEALEGKQRIRRIGERMRGLNLWSKFSYDRRLRILCPMVIMSAIISFYAFYVGWGIMGICLILLGDTIQAKFPQIFGLTFKSFITFFVILSFVFFSSTWAIGTFVHGGDFLVHPPTADSRLAPANPFTMKPTLHWSKVAEYPVCALDMESLDIVDFALIADAMYGWNTAVQLRSFGQRFNGTELGDWKYVSRNDEAANHQVWAELYFPTINITVIAVRGTATATDALEDLHYWFGVSIMQAANIFVPFLKQLPSQFVVEMLSMKFLRAVMSPPVYSELLDHVSAVRKRVGDRLVLTGHSLGGAMAAMVGAKTHTPAVSFSGPGLLYTRGRFDVDDECIRDYVLTVKPRRDIVPQVDELGGMVQEIECRRDNPLACHSTVTHMCELYAACGDKRKRDWSKATQCEAYFHGKTK